MNKTPLILNSFSNGYIDFSQYKNETELFAGTGLTPEQALDVINNRIQQLQDKR